MLKSRVNSASLVRFNKTSVVEKIEAGCKYFHLIPEFNRNYYYSEVTPKNSYMLFTVKIKLFHVHV